MACTDCCKYWLLHVLARGGCSRILERKADELYRIFDGYKPRDSNLVLSQFLKLMQVDSDAIPAA